ncbi:MAG: sigma-70 family RNA polymerase sigma factor [Planctomycetota bacterium]|nr:sigma-70 family RNA polymerase sigma factor [Planctomycetota bacterium]
MISTIAIGAGGRKTSLAAAPTEISYVAHPSFVLSETEDHLWGQDSVAIEVPPFNLAVEIEDATLADVRPGKRLSPAEEQMLFLRYNYAKHRIAKLLSPRSRLAPRHRARDLSLWRQRAAAVQAAIANANMPLVPAMTRYVQGTSLELSEMTSEGYMALLRCIDKFDVSRGFKFSTYACRAIIAQFRRMAMRASRRRERAGMDVDGNIEVSDASSRRHEDQRENAIDALQEVIRKNLAALTEDELTVLRRRFLVPSQTGTATLAQVGKTMNLSPERVRQMEKNSLLKVRAALEQHFAA